MVCLDYSRLALFNCFNCKFLFTWVRVPLSKGEVAELIKFYVMYMFVVLLYTKIDFLISTQIVF